MDSNKLDEQPILALRARNHTLDWLENLPAVLLNALFAGLEIVTLCGIVFITRPDHVMHNLPPWAWLPLMIIIVPAQIYVQCLSWKTIFSGQAPTGPAIAMRQWKTHGPLKVLIAIFWFLNFLFGSVVVIGLMQPPHEEAQPIFLVVLVLILIPLGLCLAFASNVFLILAIGAVTSNEQLLYRAWKFRYAMNLAILIIGLTFHRLVAV